MYVIYYLSNKLYLYYPDQVIYYLHTYLPYKKRYDKGIRHIY